MELRQLEYFLAVAEHANFTRAAEALHVAQPWVSAQVRRLERELGNELFDRSSRVLRLTEFGKALLPLAGAALRTVGEIRSAADAMGECCAASLRSVRCHTRHPCWLRHWRPTAGRTRR